MRLLRPKFYTLVCLISCVSSMNVPRSPKKIFHLAEFQIENYRQKSGHRVRRQASDIRSKYFYSVTHGPQNYPLLGQLSSDSMPTNDNSDVSEILRGYAFFMKQQQPIDEILNFADKEVSGTINTGQENIHDHPYDRRDDLYKFGSDSSEYELEGSTDPSYDDHIPEDYTWHDHQYFNDEDCYKLHDNSDLHKSHEGNYENHDTSKGEIGDLNYDFKTSFHKGFHGYYNDEHHTDDKGGNGHFDNGHYYEKFDLEDYDHDRNYESGKGLGNDQDHKIVSKADGFYNVFHKDEFNNARDFYDNKNEGGRFYKTEEHKKRFEDSAGEVKKGRYKDFGGGSGNSKRSGSPVERRKEHLFEEGDVGEGCKKYHDKRKSH